MIKPKYIKLILILGCVVTISGCKKCYQCYHWSADIIAIKGADTIVYTGGGPNNTSQYIDSLMNKGYAIDTAQLGWYLSNYPAPSPICGNYSLTQLDATGDSCVETSLQ